MNVNALITGGAGFIGCNLADRLIEQGDQVTIFDNLSGSGSVLNLAWLQHKYGNGLRFIHGDVHDFHAITHAIPDADVIYHLAGQVAVTSAIRAPRRDFKVNVAGTFNVLDAALHSPRNPIVLFSSTNKVYGPLNHAQLLKASTRYEDHRFPLGIPESQPMDCMSPYACSKGAAELYVLDYARSFGLQTVILRQSCIYGAHQRGTEEQGWVAWLLRAAMCGKPITIFGDGKQVRDLLFIDDLLDLYALAVQRIDQTQGQIYNVGGGPKNSLSVWEEFQPIVKRLTGRTVPVTYADWRLGDQRVYISDIRKVCRHLDWTPTTNVESGIERLWEWLSRN